MHYYKVRADWKTFLLIINFLNGFTLSHSDNPFQIVMYSINHVSYYYSHFSFFLERNMLSFFLKIMNQKCGSYVCVQLLQTLNILFENIRNETSICKSYKPFLLLWRLDFRGLQRIRSGRPRISNSIDIYEFGDRYQRTDKLVF